MPPVYLDYTASTPVLPEVLEVMLPFYATHFSSPAAPHRHGLKVRQALRRAREQVAALVHATSPEEIVFTSSGSEAANLAIKGLALTRPRAGGHIVTSAIDHPAVLGSIDWLVGQGCTCTRLPVDRQGRVAPAAVAQALTDRTILVALHQAHHDLGTLQAIADIGARASDRGIPLFVDASTSGGWMPIDVEALGITLLSLAPHRFHGPKGVGVLYHRRRLGLQSLIHGGDQENGVRAGMENVPGIVGAGVAAEIALGELAWRSTHVGGLQRRLWKTLSGRIGGSHLNGPEPGAERLPTGLSISVEGVEGEGVALACDLQGLAIGSGTLCARRSTRVDPVLEAIGVPARLARGTLHLSPGRSTTQEEIASAVETLDKVIARQRGLSENPARHPGTKPC